MPFKTFQNLSEHRRRMIVEICMEAFTLQDYDQVSLTDIIRRLGLAKGSFYRYFESKLDLYSYLVEYVKELNLSLMESSFHEGCGDILEGWFQYHMAVIRRDQENPLFNAFVYKISRERNNVLFGNLALTSRRRFLEKFVPLFRRLQEKKVFRRDADPDQMAYLLFQMQTGFLDYLVIRYGLDVEACILNRRPLIDLPPERVHQELSGFIDILRNGMFHFNQHENQSRAQDDRRPVSG